MFNVFCKSNAPPFPLLRSGTRISTAEYRTPSRHGNGPRPEAGPIGCVRRRRSPPRPFHLRPRYLFIRRPRPPPRPASPRPTTPANVGCERTPPPGEQSADDLQSLYSVQYHLLQSCHLRRSQIALLPEIGEFAAAAAGADDARHRGSGHAPGSRPRARRSPLPRLQYYLL